MALHAGGQDLGPRWVVEREVSVRAGAAAGVQFIAPRLRGIPVRGASAAVALDHRGRWIGSPADPALEPPQVDPSEAALGPADLPAAVQRALDLDAPTAFESEPALVYVTRMGTPVLAWEVQLPLTLRPEPSRRTLWISAMTGRLLGEQEQVRTARARARVFEENPSTTPSPRDVELPRMGVVAPRSALVSATIQAFNCVAEPPDEPLPWVQEGDCYPVHRARADAEGNFYVSTPNVIVEGDNVQPEDGYAELSMYYHGARFLDALAERGIESFACPQATMVANVRSFIDDQPDYEPLDNAFYTNQCDAHKGATMMFGQGRDVDFAYDGDVVYHELGHGVVAMLTPEGLGGRRLRDDATLVDSGAMNEAIADYMTYMMTDDGRVGEYVGRFWASNTRSEIRSGDNAKRCPQDTIGQVHNDGEPFAAALWSTRQRVGEPVDDLVLRTLPLLAVDASLEEGAAALLEVAAQMRVEGALGEDDVDHLQRALATRGLLDCPRVLTDPDEVRGGHSMHLRRNNDAVQPFMPGPMQLRFEAPAGTTALQIRFGLRGDQDEDDGVVVLVKHGDDRIHFTYELVAVDDPGDATGQTGRIREVTRTDGDWDVELVAEQEPGGDFAATLSGVRPGEVVHIALAALGPSDLIAASVAAVPLGAEAEPEVGETDAQTEEDAGASDASVSARETSVGGCGCHAGSASAILGPWMLLPILLRRRRRRR